MSGTTRRVRMAAPERRAAILRAAMTVFGARGYHGSSLDDIAVEAGVSKALIYEHFSSKQELHGELLAEHVAALFERLEVNATTGETGRERLRGGIDAFLGFVEEHRDAFRVMFRDAADPDIADALAAVQAQAVGVIAALISADPEVRHRPEEAAELHARRIQTHAALLSGGMQSLAIWWEDHQEVPRAEVVAHAMEFAWLGIEQLRDGRRLS